MEHSDDGSFGFILNQQNTMTVSTMMELLDLTWFGNPKETTWNGGPVMPSSGWVLHEASDMIEAKKMPLKQSLILGESIDIGHGLHITASPEKLALLAQNPSDRIRFFLGYAGWTQGQLASEIAQGAWIHSAIDVDTMFNTDPEKLWSTTLNQMGIDPRSLVPSRGVH